MSLFTTSQRTDLVARIKRLSHPLAPRPTGIPAVGRWPDGIRAVLFDLYGTFFISGAGDIGVESSGATSMYAEAATSAALPLSKESAVQLASAFQNAIKRHHTARRAAGIAWPEVDVRQAWRAALTHAGASADISDETILRFAVEVECRINPVWPMPGGLAALQRLRARGVKLGIVSNAQCFTPLLFDALLDQSIDDVGFESHCCIWSWQEGEAKPSTALLGKALGSLRSRHGIEPHEVAFIGNDMLKDMLPAKQCGCATVLFAGDTRSLRLREEHPACAALHPTRVISELDQL